MATDFKRILVTGSRGFTGIHLRAELERNGHTCIGLTDEGPVSSHEVAADLRDASAIAKAVKLAEPEYVIHLAGISYVPHESTEDIYSVNVMGAVNLLQALSHLRHPPVRVILASSSNAYGNCAASLIDEKCSLQPVSHYGASKAALEAVAHGFRAGMQILVTRPFNYTGPGQNPMFFVPKVVQHFRNRSPYIEVGNLDVERDFLDVRVVAEIYRRLLHCELNSQEAVNICSGRATRMSEVIRILRAITGHDVEVVPKPHLFRANEISRLVGDNRVLRSAIGTIPEYPFDSTLRDMLAASGGADEYNTQ